MVRLQWNLMKLGKNPSQYRFGHDSGGPEAAGGHSRPKRGFLFFDIAARVGAHVCYSLPRLLGAIYFLGDLLLRRGVYMSPSPPTWVNYSIHGPPTHPTENFLLAPQDPGTHYKIAGASGGTDPPYSRRNPL